VFTTVTRVEQAILKYIENYTNLLGYPPTYREIGQATGRSTTAAYYHCTKLVRMGRLSRVPLKVRTLRVVKYDRADG
jgi:SOS-response transcriptional repressor LexA